MSAQPVGRPEVPEVEVLEWEDQHSSSALMIKRGGRVVGFAARVIEENGRWKWVGDPIRNAGNLISRSWPDRESAKSRVEEILADHAQSLR